MVSLGSLDSSRDLQTKYVISFLFHLNLNLVLHTYKIFFDVIVFERKVYVCKQGVYQTVNSVWAQNPTKFQRVIMF